MAWGKEIRGRYITSYLSGWWKTAEKKETRAKLKGWGPEDQGKTALFQKVLRF